METMEKIKVEDLSVGDWVRTKDGNVTVDIISPIEVVVMNDYGNLCACKIEDIKPIPITAEMLEKNGFEEIGGSWYNSEARMEFEQYKDGWCRTINCGEYGVYFIKYVHQLQHALRLKNTNKEIVLWN